MVAIAEAIKPKIFFDRIEYGANMKNVAVLGSTNLIIAVPRIATTTTRAITTIMSVFVWCVLRPALFCTRTGRWESVGRVEGESRFAPVMCKSIRK
jgi:hypothetical protein